MLFHWSILIFYSMPNGLFKNMYGFVIRFKRFWEAISIITKNNIFWHFCLLILLGEFHYKFVIAYKIFLTALVTEMLLKIKDNPKKVLIHSFCWISPHYKFLISLLKISLPYMYAFISGLSSLFHWYICLFMTTLL